MKGFGELLTTEEVAARILAANDPLVMATLRSILRGKGRGMGEPFGDGSVPLKSNVQNAVGAESGEKVAGVSDDAA